MDSAIVSTLWGVAAGSRCAIRSAIGLAALPCADVVVAAVAGDVVVAAVAGDVVVAAVAGDVVVAAVAGRWERTTGILHEGA